MSQTLEDAHTQSPGTVQDDMISHMSADAFNEAADRARDVWDQALARLDDIIAQLQRSKRAWDAAERANAASWDR